MSNWGYVSVAYGVAYFVMGVYAVYLIRRRTRAQQALRVELHRLEE